MPPFPPPTNYVPSSINLEVSAEEEGSPKDGLLSRKLIQLSLSDGQLPKPHTPESKGKEKAKSPPVYHDLNVEIPSLGDGSDSFKLKNQCFIEENYYIDMDML